jgi:ATPase subunit of ABC transporter with duplicated ATPase domains
MECNGRDCATNMDAAYTPQIIAEFDSHSGGEHFNKALSATISNAPNLLLLDEPTNHLNAENRRSLIRKLQNCSGMLIIATHDTKILRNCVDILWHIDCGKVVVFNGKYDNYMRQKQVKDNFSLKQKMSSTGKMPKPIRV